MPQRVGFSLLAFFWMSFKKAPSEDITYTHIRKTYEHKYCLQLQYAVQFSISVHRNLRHPLMSAEHFIVICFIFVYIILCS